MSVPARLARALLRPLVRTVYSFRIEGAAHVPLRGGALLVANHVSYADAFLLAASIDRPVRFLMHRAFFEQPLIGAFARLMGAIPVAAGESQEERERALSAAAEALRAGELVAIFAEGRITRTGALLGFRPGLETIARLAAAPIVPCALDEVWGSIFSYAGGRVLWKWPRQLPYHVRVRFGALLPADTQSFVVRDRIQELLARAAEERALETPGLGPSILAAARRHPRRTAVVDESGIRLDYRGLLALGLALARKLEGRLGSSRCVGALALHDTRAAGFGLAAALAGRAVVHLDPNLGPESAARTLRQAGARHVLASKRTVESLGWPRQAWLEGIELLDLSETLASPGRRARVLAGLACALPPAWLAGLLPRAARPTDTAVIVAKGGAQTPRRLVALSHANIVSNVRALAQVAGLTSEDRLLAVLPLHHAYGYTVTFWAPLLCGASVVMLAEPRDGARLARLAREERVTGLVATPSLYAHWLRELEPAALGNVRLSISGGEALPMELAAAWQARFGHGLHEGYGATELSPVVSIDLPDIERGGQVQRNHSPGTVGRPLPGVAVRIVREADGAACGPDERGRILVRGPGVMLGYLDDGGAIDPEGRDGWFDTGDLGALDRDGFLTLASPPGPA